VVGNEIWFLPGETNWCNRELRIRMYPGFPQPRNYSPGHEGLNTVVVPAECDVSISRLFMVLLALFERW